MARNIEAYGEYMARKMRPKRGFELSPLRFRSSAPPVERLDQRETGRCVA